jgi:hypothetical protein
MVKPPHGPLRGKRTAKGTLPFSHLRLAHIGQKPRVGSTYPGKVAARLCEAELAIDSQAHFGRIRILLAVIFPPADRAKTHGIGRFQGLISATWAPKPVLVAFHANIDGEEPV